MTLRYLLEHLAVGFGAATGPLAARGKDVDLFGVIVLGLVTAVGGGTLRDLILDQPVFWVGDSSFVITAAAGSCLTFCVFRSMVPPATMLELVDALALAFVTMLGTSKTFHLGHAAPVCVVLGVATGVAGGMIRDVLSGEIPMVLRAHIYLYATAALGGSVAYLAAAAIQPGRPMNLLIGAAVVLGLRLAALRWRLRLPKFDRRE